MVVLLDKLPGETPLEAVEAYRAATPAARASPMVYAGRLDPMAEGLLLVLTDEDRHALPEQLRHDKTYTATFLFGLSSDTHDALGRLAPGAPPDPPACLSAVSDLAGTHVLPLPAWSAYRVRGRALHAWAREGRLAEVAIPTRPMVVHAVAAGARLAGLDAEAAAASARARIDRVRGDFRQAEASNDWRSVAARRPAVVAVTAELHVSSGTYVRALAHALGERLGCGALLHALRRTRIGPYTAPSDGPATRPPPSPPARSHGSA